MKKQTTHQGFYALLVLLGGASYGCVSAIVKMAYGHGFAANAVTLGQFYFAALILWIMIFLFARHHVTRIARKDWIHVLLLGFFSAATSILYYISLYMLPAWLAMILLFQFSWMTFVIDFAVTRQKPTRLQMVSIFIIVIGTLLAVGITGAIHQHITWLGIIFGLLSGLSYALFLYVNGMVNTATSPLFRTALITTVSAILVTLYEHPSTSVFVSIGHMSGYGIAIGLLSQAVPTLLFSIGIPRIGGASAAILGSIELPVAVVLAVWILRESVSLSTWIGVVLILAGIVFGERSRSQNVTIL